MVDGRARRPALVCVHGARFRAEQRTISARAISNVPAGAHACRVFRDARTRSEPKHTAQA